jgi:hypothetical protein
MVIWDNYARGCATRVNDLMKDNFVTCGIVKSGSGANILMQSLVKEVRNLTKRDVIIFWGDVNDVRTNNSEAGLRHIINFVRDNGHTNIILLSASYRHDLPKFSCVNKEIIRFNRKLMKCIKLYKYCTFLNVNQNRRLFINHGLHLNGLDKDVISEQVVW